MSVRLFYCLKTELLMLHLIISPWMHFFTLLLFCPYFLYLCTEWDSWEWLLSIQALIIITGNWPVSATSSTMSTDFPCLAYSSMTLAHHKWSPFNLPFAIFLLTSQCQWQAPGKKPFPTGISTFWLKAAFVNVLNIRLLANIK